MKKLLLLCIGFFLLTACSEDVNIPTTPGSLVGIVADNTTGEPVPTVRLELTPGGISTVTGSDGGFSFNNLEAGDYTISLSKNGYKSVSNDVTVNSGAPSEVHLLIERIPAVITIDREVIDFGENDSMNTLSFNMVNNNYVDLDYTIIENCGWIESVDPQTGTLPYGKTATVVVKIDRTALLSGVNETVIVVSTSDGSSELKVKATGIERGKATLNTLEATNIRTTSACLNAEIISSGYPVYTERGFVYNDNPMPNHENAIAVIPAMITDETEFSMDVDGLELGKTYYVRSYAINEIGIAYSSNQIKFTTTTTMAQVTIADIISNTNNMTISLYGKVTDKGDPEYTECGFLYSDTQTVPTFADTKLVATSDTYGNFEIHNIGPLPWDTDYYVRAYVTNAAGTAYSEVITVSINSQLPSVLITDKYINFDNLTAKIECTIDNIGLPSYTECGIVYSKDNTTPTINDTIVTATADNRHCFDVQLSECFTYDTKYYLCAYATNMMGTAYSDTETIIISTRLPAVNTLEITDVDRDHNVGILHGEITDAGIPGYTERGFVYSDVYEHPTIMDNKIVVDGSGIGTFEYRVTELSSDRSYYIRAYATNSKGTTYGDTYKLFNYNVIELPTAGIAVQKDDIGYNGWVEINSMCENSDYEGFTDWRLPTIDELYILYNNKDTIGNFTTSLYWSSESYNSFNHWIIGFSSGSKSYDWDADSNYGRCVRTLSKSTDGE